MSQPFSAPASRMSVTTTVSDNHLDRLPAIQPGNGFLAARGFQHGAAAVLKVADDHGTQQGFVLDDENDQFR